MLNLFTVYWRSGTQEGYEKAVAWLKYIAAGDNPSIKCLWNLAVLYYYGENLPNNVLSKDYTKAKSILSQIKEMPVAGKNEDVMKVIVNAQKFYPLVGRLNDFSLSGKDIHDDILNSIVPTKTFVDKADFFYRATALSLKPGYKLGLHVANEITDDIGRENHFFIYDDKGNEYDIYKSRTNLEDVDTSLINVAPTAMGAWQLYLLITSPTIMPVLISRDRDARKFVFFTEDLYLAPLQNLDFATLKHDGLLFPDVVVSKDGKTADVYCCFWNYWRGLIREHVRITFQPDGSAIFGKPDQYVFYDFNCDIYH